MRVRILACVSLLALGLWGCPQTIRGEDVDGGTDAHDSGTTEPGQDAGPREDAGTPADGGTNAEDGGTISEDGGVITKGALTWATMAPPSSSGYESVSGTAKNDVYAVGATGEVVHFDGFGWTQVAHSPGNLTLRSVYVAPDGAVFAVGGGQAVVCEHDCTIGSNYVWSTVSAELTGVCGRSSQSVYATGTGGSARSSNAGVLYHFDTAMHQWKRITADTGSYFNTGCWVSPSGAVFLAAQATVVRCEQGSFTPEPVNFPGDWTTSDIAQQLFEAVWGVDDEVFAAGYRRGIIARNANGTWDYQQQPDGLNNYHALAGTGSSDVVVGGTVSGDDKALRVFDGTSWTTPASVPDVSIWGLYAADDQTYFAAGLKGATGAIWIGTRP